MRQTDQAINTKLMQQVNPLLGRSTSFLPPQMEDDIRLFMQSA
jgi:hypothetical protein